jgi:glycerol dehydrogenase-like iron-containing ADH family enzyme
MKIAPLMPSPKFVGSLGDALATWFKTRTIKEAGSKGFLESMATETSTALSKLCSRIILKDGGPIQQLKRSKPRQLHQRLSELLKLKHF